MNKYEHKCIRCNSNAVVADFYDFDTVTMRCDDCGLVWDETVACSVAIPPTEHKSKLPAFDTDEYDVVNHPQHYANGMVVELECIMFKRWLPGDLSDAFKYVWRAGDKEDLIQDLEKALWYLDDALEYGINFSEPKLVPFLPKSSLPEWKYDALWCILNGKVEDARLGVLEHLNSVKPAHNNRKR